MLISTSVPTGSVCPPSSRLLRCHTGIPRYRRQHAEAFVHHALQQRQLRQLLDRRRCAMQHRIQLIHDIRRDLRMLRQQEQRPGERICRRFMARGEDHARMPDHLVFLSVAPLSASRAASSSDSTSSLASAVTRLCAMIARIAAS